MNSVSGDMIPAYKRGDKNLNLRHEWKHLINYGDMIVLRKRLSAVMKSDKNAVDGRYFIRSLYFDTPADTALREKIDGISHREKFRIRYYNFDTTVIHLEKKSKTAGLCSKKSANLTKERVQKIIDGDIGWMKNSEDELIRELYQKMTVQQLKPKTIVDYWREPFVYPAGNVRITIYYEIRTGLASKKFFSKDCPTVPIPDNPIILEVKWDEFLPTVIRNAVQIGDRRTSAFSKYATCRIYD